MHLSNLATTTERVVVGVVEEGGDGAGEKHRNGKTK